MILHRCASCRLLYAAYPGECVPELGDWTCRCGGTIIEFSADPTPSAAVAPTEGEPDESEPEIDWWTERGEAARAALLGFIRNGGCSDCSALRFRITELESALEESRAALSSPVRAETAKLNEA